MGLDPIAARRAREAAAKQARIQQRIAAGYQQGDAARAAGEAVRRKAFPELYPFNPAAANIF
jgi:hypothetical protein